MTKVVVSAPARLHLGDIDPFGIGRFGYAPILAIDKPRVIVEASKSSSLVVAGLDAEETQIYAERILKAFNFPGANIRVLSSLPRHFGFGSTTQLSLSIGKAITSAYGMDLNVVDLAKALKRTSTGGLHTFQHGGFVVAGGLRIKRGEPFFDREEPLIPPLIFRNNFPEEWRFLIVKPCKAPISPDGEVEETAFKKLNFEKPPSSLIHETYFILASKLVPAVIEEDAQAFGEALTRIQVLVGRIYKPVQGSIFNPASAWIIPILHKNKALGIGQSSWGPAVYAFIENEKRALEMEKAIRNKLDGRAETFITKVDNSGANVTILET